MESLVGGKRNARATEHGYDVLVVVGHAVDDAAVPPLHEDVVRTPVFAVVHAHKRPSLRSRVQPPLLINHDEVHARIMVCVLVGGLTAVLGHPCLVLTCLAEQEVVAVIRVHRRVRTVVRLPGKGARSAARVNISLWLWIPLKFRHGVTVRCECAQTRDIVLVRVPGRNRGGGRGVVQ